MDTSSSYVGLPCPRPKSEVWLFFKKLEPELAQCLVCGNGKTIKLAKKSTSGMIAHLKAYHREQYLLIVDHKNHSGRRARQCAAIMIENPSVPPSLFRSDSFLALFPEVEWHNFPSATVMNTIVLPEMLAEITAKNRADLSGLPVTLVMDLWNNQAVSINFVLAYYVNAMWETEGRLIAVNVSTDNRTSDEFRLQIEKSFSDLEVVAIVHSDDAAGEYFRFRHSPCVNYRLTKLVHDGLKSWSAGAAVIKKLREFARALNEPEAGAQREAFFRQCILHSVPVATLPSPPPDRWGGALRLIEAALVQLPAINGTLAEMASDEFTADDLLLLEEAATVLRPFGTFGFELAQEGRPMSETLFVLQRLEKHLESCTSSSSLASILRSSFSLESDYFFTSPSVLSSVFFDPGAIFHFKTEVNWRDVAAGFSPTLGLLSSSTPSSFTPSKSTFTPSSCLSSRRAALYGDGDGPPAKVIKKESPSSPLDAELLLYLEQSLGGVDVTLEALDYWKTNQDKYPNLSLLARRYLSTPPTAIDAGKVLSAAGLLYRKTFEGLFGHAGNCAEELCMLRLSKMGSLRALSHAPDRVIVPTVTAESAPEEVDEVETEEQRSQWEEETEGCEDTRRTASDALDRRLFSTQSVANQSGIREKGVIKDEEPEEEMPSPV